MGPLEVVKPWTKTQILGVHRFLHRIWSLILDESDRLRSEAIAEVEPEGTLRRTLHRTIAAVTADIEGLRFNTAISRQMELVNELQDTPRSGNSPARRWKRWCSSSRPSRRTSRRSSGGNFGHGESLAYDRWPEHDPTALIEDTVEVAVQVNGKVRDRLTVPAGAAEEEVRKLALERPRVRDFLAGKTVAKAVYVPGKLLNLVAK